MKRLSIVRGARDGHAVELPGGSITIGRDPKACGLVLDGEGVATVHCRIALVKGGGVGIQDLGTDAGTFVNGRRVQAARLTSGDRIRVGANELVFEDSDDAARANAPTPVPAVTSAPAASATQTPAPGAAPRGAGDPDLTGRELGGYKIEAPLGRGGMGTVYRAIQTSLHRPVALKVLSPRLTRDVKLVEQFQREARAAAQLHHPNVVTIFDVGAADDLFFFSMEILEGGSVEDVLKRQKKLPVARALAIARDAARALEFAESKKLLHRDVKPDNLMLTSLGVAKLADLGLAGQAGDLQAGARFATPHFAAPEQVAGGPVDARADLYALGATLFRMLTGRTPHQGATVPLILDAKRSTEPPSVRSIDATIPEDVDALVARMLRRAPAERPASAKEVAAAIDAMLAPAARSTRAIWITAAALVLVAGGAAAYFAARPTDPTATKRVVIRDTETEDRLRRERDETANHSKELAAENAFMKAETADVSPLERAALYDAVAKAHAGTPAAEKAVAQAKKLRDAEAARVAAESARAARIEAFRAALDSRLRELLDASRFAQALELPASLEGYDVAMTDADAKAAVDNVAGRVLVLAETFVKDASTRSKQLLASGNVAGAESEAKRIADAVAGMQTPNAELAPRVAALRKAGTDVLAAVDAARADSQRSALVAERLAAKAALEGPGAVLESLRVGRFAEARDRANAACEAATSPELRAFLERVRDDAGAAATLFAKLVAASQSKSLGAEPFLDPNTGKPARLASVDENGARFEPKGAAPSVVPFERFGSGARAAALLQRGAEKSDALLVARAARALALAFDLTKLRAYQRAMKTDASAHEAPPALNVDGFTLAIETLDQAAANGAAAESVSAMRAEIDAERAAAESLSKGLAAFAGGRYVEAERAFADLSEKGRRTVTLLLASDGTTDVAGAAR